MKRFLLKIALVSVIIIIVMLIIITVSSEIVKNRQFRNWETESNTLVIRENTRYDLGILGISHARNFSRHDNHRRVEKILDKSILNLGQGRGKCGVKEQLFYLQYAYSKGVKIDTIVYVMSPPMVFGDYLNRASHTFEEEVFDWDFLNQYIKFEADNKRERIFSYLRYKLNPSWIFMRPYSDSASVGALNELEWEVVQDGFNTAYKDSSLEDSFTKNIEIMERTIQLAHANGSHVMMFIPPALFGEWPQHKEVMQWMREMYAKYGTEFADYSASVKDPKLYYDHHHLNSSGVDHFANNYLKKFLQPK